MAKKSSLGRNYFLASLTSVLLFVVLFSSFLAYYEYRNFRIKSTQVDRDFQEYGREELYANSHKIVTFLENETSIAEQKMKDNIKNRLNYGYSFINKIYTQYGKKESKAQVIKRITATFSDFRLGTDNYFFIFDRNFHPLLGGYKAPEGKTLLDLPDNRSVYAFRELMETALKGGGFVSYKWKQNEKGDKSEDKISYVRYFAPYDLVVGTGGFLDDAIEEVKTDALVRIDHLLTNENIFFYIIDLNKMQIVGHSDRTLDGVYIDNMTDSVQKESVLKLIRQADLTGDGKAEFLWRENLADKPLGMESYNFLYGDWNWLIGSAVYTDDIHQVVAQGKKTLLMSLVKSMGLIIFVFTIVFIAAYFITRRSAVALEREFSQFLRFFGGAVEKGELIDVETMEHEEFRRLAEHANRMSIEIAEKTKALKKAMESERLANKTNTEIISHISHELRLPLAGVLEFIELLDGTDLNRVQKHFLKIIKYSAGNLVGAVNDILGFSRFKPGTVEIHSERFSILSTFESMSDLFGFITSESGIEFASYIDPSIPAELTGDVLRINQIVSNLVENAVGNNTPGGYVKLEITKEWSIGNRVGLCFKIEDNGESLSDDYLKAVEKIIKSDISSEDFQSTGGIGLRVAALLLRLLGGDLSYRPLEKGRGSVFSFMLEFTVANTKQLMDTDKVKDCYSAVYVDADAEKASVTEQVVMSYLKAFGNEASYFSSLADLEKLPFLDIVFYVYSAGTKEKFIESLRTHESIPIVTIMDVHKRMEENELTKVASSVLYRPVGLSGIYDAVYSATSYMHDEPQKEEKKQEHGKGVFSGLALIAEDNPLNQKIVRLILEELGLESVCVDNGRKAVDAFKQGGFNIVIMDINMPELGGIEAAKLIHEYEKQNLSYHVPIIALTAYSIKGDSERFIEAGMDDYLAKPVTIDIMRETLQKHLKGGKK